MAAGYNKLRAPELSTWSIPQWFIARCAATPDRVAFRYKDRGIYQDVTWRNYRRLVSEFLAGLEALGLRPGDRVAAMADPCWEFLISDMAALCGGAICYGIYTTCSVSEVEYQLENGDADFFCAENQEFVDKLLNTATRVPRIRKIIVFDTRALFQYTDERLISFEDVVALGRARLADTPNPQNFPRRTRCCRTRGGHFRSRLHFGHDGTTQGRDARSRVADVGLRQFLPGSISRIEYRRTSCGSASADGAPDRALDVDLPAAGRRSRSAYWRGGRRPARARSTRSSRRFSTSCRAFSKK